MTDQFSFSHNPLLSSLPPFSLKKNDASEKLYKEKGLECFDFTLGDPKESTPDFIIKALCSGVKHTSQYPPVIGGPKLREAAAQWLWRRFSVSVCPQTQIIASNGSKEAVFHIPQVILNSNKRNAIAFPEPGYPVYKTGAILAGGQTCQIPLNPDANYIFNIDDIPQNKIDHIAAIWLSYPHNPTGAVLPKNEAQKIYAWALKNNIIILSDECYTDMYFEGEEPPLSMLQIAQSCDYKNVLSFFSLSKRSGMTGYRSGFIAGDKNLIHLYTQYRFHIGVGTPDFIQNAAVAAWNDDVHVKERNKIFFQKRKLLEDFFHKNNMQFLKSRTTFYMWVKTPSYCQSAEEYSETLKEIGIFITPGRAFGESCKNYFRLALVPTVENIERALSVWQAHLLVHR